MLKHTSLLARWFGSAVLVVSLSGCLGGGSLNTETAEYVPEQRPLNVIAPEDIEVQPGDSVSLTSRLTGTTNGQTLLWTQIGGPEMPLENPTAETITFDIPASLSSAKLIFQVAALNADGSAATGEDGTALVDVVEVTVFDPNAVVVIDVSDTSVTLNGAVLARPGDEQFIQGALNDAHTADLQPGMSATFNIDDLSGFFTLNVRYGIPSDYGGKLAVVNVNGIEYELEFNATGSWEEIRVGVVELSAGLNTIEIGGGWNFYRVDSISLIPSAEPPPPQPVAPTLVNPNASDEAMAVMTFLSEQYLTKTLSGQTEFPQRNNDDYPNQTFPLIETGKILAATGDDAPAIVAFDFMNYSASYAGGNGDHTGLSEAMIAHHNERNMILSALFHWRAPSGNTGDGDGSFFTDNTTFNFAAALADTSSAEYASLLADIDTVAAELQKFEDAGIPILWRPLHEAQGGWFWWGAQGSDAFKSLWQLMYTRMTDVHGLDNLIWVFTHTDGLSADWYPGDQWVDIVGFDGYGEPRNDDTHTFTSQYKTLQERHNGTKLVALTETGTIPDVALMHEQGAWWSFFITWNSEFWDPQSVIGPQGADSAEVDSNYSFDGVLNLADVPSGRTPVTGSFANFEPDTSGWEAQVNWSATDGLTTSGNWANSAAHSLAITKDMTQLDALDNVVLQTYPEGGIDVSGVSLLTARVNTLNAGSTVNAHLFFKAPEGVESWPEAQTLTEDGLLLSIDVSQVDMLDGFGVRFQGLDGNASAAQYLLDDIQLDGTPLYDFEPETQQWQSQVAWSDTTGATLSGEWSNAGAQSLAFIKDLAALGASENVVLQRYPEGGYNVTDINTVSLVVNAIDAGSDVNAHIFFKAPDGVESWPEAIAIATGADSTGTTLEIDVSAVDTLDGLGIRFNGIDSTSQNARFFIDSIQADGNNWFEFENTGSFELQVNWAPAPGLQLSQNWAASGYQALAAMVNINDGDEVILQTYPQNGILLDANVQTLQVTAFVPDAGADVTATLWAKDQDGVWRDAGATPVASETGSLLTLDISDLSELQGFGVQFKGLTAADSQFYIDNVRFEE